MSQIQTVQFPLVFDHSIRIGDARRSAIVFVRVQEAFPLRVVTASDAPLVARYHVGIEETLLRRVGDQLVTATLKARPGKPLRQGNPFPEFVTPGSIDVASISDGNRLSDDLAACRRIVERETGRAVVVDGLVHRPTDGLVTVGSGRQRRRVVTVETLRASRRPVVDVFDLVDPMAPVCLGLQVLDERLAKGAWDRRSAVLGAACDEILRGLQGDLMDVDTVLVRRWTRLVSDLRKNGADDEIHHRCLELLRVFVAKASAKGQAPGGHVPPPLEGSGFPASALSCGDTRGESMIVDYPILHEVPWIPKGKRKNVGFSFFETIPLEILEVASEDAPVVVEVAYGRTWVRRIDDEKPPTHVLSYRKIDGRWYEPSRSRSDGVTSDMIAGDPGILRLVAEAQNWNISRSSPSYYGDNERTQTIADGTVLRIPSRSALPDGRYGHVPHGYEEDDGRTRQAQEEVAKLVLVDGVVYQRALEPVLRLDVSWSGRNRFHKIEVVSYDAERTDQGVLHPLSAMARLDAYARRKAHDDPGEREIFYPLPDVVLHRPDLLDFDPTPVSLHEATIACLKAMVGHIADRSPSYFAAFAALRDQFAPGTSRWSENIPQIRIDTKMDVDRRFVALIRCVRLHMDEVVTSANLDTEYGVYPSVRRALAMTPFADDFEHATIAEARRLGYVDEPSDIDAVPALAHLDDDPEPEDLAAIVTSHVAMGPRP